jgi:hypothetical protein
MPALAQHLIRNNHTMGTIDDTMKVVYKVKKADTWTQWINTTYIKKLKKECK